MLGSLADGGCTWIEHHPAAANSEMRNPEVHDQHHQKP